MSQIWLPVGMSPPIPEFYFSEKYVMQIDRKKFTEEGYNILSNVVPPNQLESLRHNIEHMVNQRKEISAQQRTPHEPEGGSWQASAQPRLQFDADCDTSSSAAIEFLLHENTLGVSKRLIKAKHVVPHQFSCLCSGSYDAGPMRWHRDIGPGEPAPLRGMISNMEHHGPSYLQWNIALYDDNVLWIVPGSHRQTNTDQVNHQLAEDPSVPLPGSIPVELKAGDGVVYTHLLLHWGSYYSSKMRRTLHPGYRPFGFAAMPNVHWRHWKPGFYHYLPDMVRQQFETWDQIFFAELDLVAEILHAITDNNRTQFLAAFEQLHPSPYDCMVSIIMLSKLAAKLYKHKYSNDNPSALWGNGRDLVYLAGHFNDQQTEILCQRFHELDQRLKPSSAEHYPGFQKTSDYNAIDMPPNFEMDDFIDSWENYH